MSMDAPWAQPGAPDILKQILARKVEEVALRQAVTPQHQLECLVEGAAPPRGFARAIEERIVQRGYGVIAEIKRASPSKGLLRADYHPAVIARGYERAGAACLSVLTDVDFFRGSDEHLRAARDACALPVLRKDFTIDPYQVYEARALGADAILLIVAALGDAQLRDLYGLARDLGLDALVEVHDEEDLERALAFKPGLLGINNRNLRTFDVSLDTTLGLLPSIPADSRVVAESGIHTSVDIARLKGAGVQAFLVGEAFMRADDPGARLAELFGFREAS